LDGDGGGYAAAGGEAAGKGHPAGLAGGNQIVKNAIDGGFIEDTPMAILLQVKFEGFQLETLIIGTINDGYNAEIGLSGLGAEAGKLGTVDLDFVVAVGLGVGEGFQQGIGPVLLRTHILVCTP